MLLRKMVSMKKLDLLYEGKAKSVYNTDNKDHCIIEFRDDLTALNGARKGSFEGKGGINCFITSFVYEKLAAEGIKTHYIKKISATEILAEKVTIIPLEVIIRNTAAGSFAKKYGVQEGDSLLSPVLEFSYKNDELNDPLINESQAMALGIATKEQIETISLISFKINECLKQIFRAVGLMLIDFKIEFGVSENGEIILADEVSQDTCRLWDIETKEKLDKDLFRFNQGNVKEAYSELFRRFSCGNA